MGENRCHRALVQTNLGVGQVVVVEQQEVRSLLTDQRRHLGALTVDVELDPVGPRELVALQGVAADRQGVRTKRRERLDRALGDDRSRDDVLVVHRDLEAQSVDARSLEPQLRPGAQVPTGGLLEVPEQVREGGVLPGVLGEVVTKPGRERLATDIGHELLEHRGALGVGDAVEVDLDVLEVADVRDDRVS